MPAMWVAIQKNGSLTWQIAIEPAPAAAAASARPVALSRPSAGSIGSTMPDAVSTALSELPCRVFTMAAARNGASRPSRGSTTDSASSSDRQQQGCPARVGQHLRLPAARQQQREGDRQHGENQRPADAGIELACA